MARRANLKKDATGPMKMKKGGSFLEPDKELKFGGAPKSKKYQGGGASYPVYGKNTDQAKSFRSAFAAARAAGKDKFTWEGRSYGTRKAGESAEQYTSSLKGARSANTPSTLNRTETKPLSSGVTPRTGLATGPRPTLTAASSKNKRSENRAAKKEARKSNRQEKRKENKLGLRRKQGAIKGSSEKAVGKKTAPMAPGAGMKISTATESTPNTRTRTSLSSVRDSAMGRAVDTSKMKDSGTPASRPAAKPAAPSSKRADRINKRAERVTDRKAKRAAVSSAKEGLKAARKMQGGGARKTMVGQRMEPNAFTKKYDSDSKGGNLSYGQTSVLNANKGEFDRKNSMSPSNPKKVATKMQGGGVKECQSGGCYNSQRAARTEKKQNQARRNPKRAQRLERNAMQGRGKMANRKRRQQGRGSVGGKIGELAGLAGFGIGAKKMIDYIKANK